jgi:hypothetical protein
VRGEGGERERQRAVRGRREARRAARGGARLRFGCSDVRRLGRKRDRPRSSARSEEAAGRTESRSAAASVLVSPPIVAGRRASDEAAPARVRRGARIDEVMNETPSSELRTSSEALLGGPNKKKQPRTGKQSQKSWFVFSFEAFCVSQSESGTQRFFLAGVRTPEGRVKADNDNHYITRNSDY